MYELDDDGNVKLNKRGRPIRKKKFRKLRKNRWTKTRKPNAYYDPNLDEKINFNSDT